MNDGYVFGKQLDEEHLGFDAFETREEAIAAGRLEYPGQPFKTARRTIAAESMPCALDAWGAFDSAENGNWNETVHENWQDMVFGSDSDPARGADRRTLIDDLQARLERAWDEWTEQHKLTTSVVWIEHVEAHEP